jgi:hypothetical protein
MNRVLRTSIRRGAALLVLAGAAACSNADGAADGAAPAAGGDAPASTAEVVGAEMALADLPQLRPGVWRTVTTSEGGDKETMRECVGPNQAIDIPQDTSKDCLPKVNRVAGGFRIASRCTTDGMSGMMNMTMTGDFQTRTRAELELGLGVEGQPMNVAKQTAEAVWEGPCPAGQEPGDMDDE